LVVRGCVAAGVVEALVADCDGVFAIDTVLVPDPQAASAMPDIDKHASSARRRREVRIPRWYSPRNARLLTCRCRVRSGRPVQRDPLRARVGTKDDVRPRAAARPG